MPQVKKMRLTYIGGNGPAAQDFAENHGLELVRYPNANAVQPGDFVIVDFKEPVPSDVPNREDAHQAAIMAVKKSALVFLAFQKPITSAEIINFWLDGGITAVIGTKAAGLVFLD